jgi:glutamyl-tRNA synthetase
VTIAGRFAPSPSGPMHIGNVRTALLAWLDARSRGGRVLLRIEDLDRDRCRPEYAAAIRDELHWLGLDWDEETRPQSQRLHEYEAAIQRLAERGLVYECFCTRRELAVASAPHGTADEPPAYPGTCRSLTDVDRDRLRAEGRQASLRVRMPEQPVVVRDRIHGQGMRPIGGDVVVRRSDGLHAYQLAVVVDDAADGVTDVCRGDDLLGSAARQVALGGLLGLPAPVYAHVPLVLGEDGGRLAKRHGAVTVADLREAGAEPAALVGALAATSGLGDGSPARPAELVSGFEVERISRRPWRLTADGPAAIRATASR